MGIGIPTIFMKNIVPIVLFFKKGVGYVVIILTNWKVYIKYVICRTNKKSLKYIVFFYSFAKTLLKLFMTISNF